jgi:8-oxo-dGTP pyrophosphatase MutT (NUDIX family)
VTDPRKFVRSKAAARALGIDRATLWRWKQAGIVTPAHKTAGGQARWDIEQLHEQVRQHREGTLDQKPDTPEAQPIVAAIVTSELGVLISRRNDGKPPWGFITGEIEPGESSADAAVREVKEETGLRVNYSKIIGRRVHPKTNRTMIYLACEPAAADLDVFVGDTEELAEVRWAPMREADELLPGMFEPVRVHLFNTLDE